MNRFFLLCLLCLPLWACDSTVEYEDDWLDSPLTEDPSLSDPRYRVSTRPGLTPLDRLRPVIIAAHGFTASTYEWMEFWDYAEDNSNVLVSLVLLGGHGRDVDTFKASTWEDWGQSILDEYNALVAQGYTNISLAGASTSGALILEQLSRGAYSGTVKPNEIFFIDTIVISGDKLLTLVNALGPILGNVPGDPNDEEKKHWYTNRPYQVLKELNDLLGVVRGELEEGITLPAGTSAKIYKTSRDEVADPVSALYMYKGLQTASGGKVDVQMFDSSLHVFTRLTIRTPGEVTATDQARQLEVFNEMLLRVQL